MPKSHKRSRLGEKKTDDEAEPSVLPFRDCRNLHASQLTVYCALQRHCVPCAYKVGCFDVALDHEFCRAVPNQRPEQCPRAKEVKQGVEGTLGYRREMSVLAVGDGDFTFSLALARLGSDKAISITATSYESKASLLDVYPGIEETFKELEQKGATVCFKVDATRLKETMPKTAADNKFDRIVWNFPCSAVEKGQDGQNEEMERNKGLVREFVANARHLLKAGGQIHLNHKTKPPFNQWKVEEIAVESCQANEPIVVYSGRVVFDRFLLPPYIPRKALHHKSFPAHDACTYVFGLESTALDLFASSSVAEFDVSDANSKLKPDATTLVPVTPELLRMLRSALMRPSLDPRKQANKAPKRGKHY